MNDTGHWKVAPAYDLTFSSSAHGMHSTMISGESANPTKQHLIDLANYFKIKNASYIIDDIQEVIYNWKDYANQCDIRADSKNRIQKVIGKK